jgi:hypothetical protein
MELGSLLLKSNCEFADLALLTLVLASLTYFTRPEVWGPAAQAVGTQTDVNEHLVLGSYAAQILMRFGNSGLHEFLPYISTHGTTGRSCVPCGLAIADTSSHWRAWHAHSHIRTRYALPAAGAARTHMRRGAWGRRIQRE